MISDEDRATLGDLAMRTFDKIEAEYGEDAELVAASIVFEVRVKNEDDRWEHHGNYESTEHSSAHIGGLHQQMAHYLLNPAFALAEEEDD